MATVIVTGKRPWPWRDFFAAGAIIAVSLFPLVALTVSAKTQAIAWVGPVRWVDPILLWGFLSGAMFFNVWSWMLGISYFILTVTGLWLGLRRGNDNGSATKPWDCCFLTTWLLLPVAIGLIGSPLKPMFVLRYFLVCLPALTFLASIGLSHIRPRALFLSCFAVLLVLSSIQVWLQYTAYKTEDWRGAAHHILSNAGANDAIVFHNAESIVAFNYYLERTGTARSKLAPYAFENGRVVPHDCRFVKNTWEPVFPGREIFEAPFSRVWVFLNRVSKDDRRKVKEYLSAHYKCKSEVRYAPTHGAAITVLLFERDSPP
jgi:hypothetical protein